MPTNHQQSIKATIFDKKGRILSIGHNSYIKSHPYQKKLASKVGEEYKIYLHAEVDAILKCSNLDKAYKILITRVGRSGNLLLAKPCKICESAIKATNIKIVEHS